MKQLLNKGDRLVRASKRLAAPVRKHPAVCLSVLFYWYWQVALFQSPSTFYLVDGADEALRLKTVLLFSGALTYAVAWLFYKRFDAFSSKRFCKPIIVVAMVVGTIAFLSPAQIFDSTAAVAVKACGACFIGVGSSLFVIELGRIFAQVGPYCALSAGALGAFAGSALHLIVAALSIPAVEVFLLCLMPIAAMYCLKHAFSGFPKTVLFGYGLSLKPRFPARFSVTCLVQGLSLGAMSALLLQSGESGNMATCMIAYIVGSLVMVAAAVTLKLDFNHLVYQVGFPLMGLGFLFYACFPDVAAMNGFVFSVGYCYTYVVTTCIITYFSNCLGCSPVWIVSLTTFHLLVGQIVGFLGSTALLIGQGGVAFSESIPVLFAFLIPTAALLLFDKEDLASGWGAFSPANSNSFKSELLFNQIASQYKLTKREQEVCALLFKGHNKKTISDELGLSGETVKTHIGKIYAKLMVHSQQELIRLVEEEKESLK